MYVFKITFSYYFPTGGNLRALDNSVVPSFIVDDKKILLIKEDSFEVVNKELEDDTASATIIDGANGHVLLQTWTDDVKVRYIEMP